MVTPRTEMDDIQDLGRQNADLYSEVDQNFDQFFFARLVADALASQLSTIITTGNITPETDGKNHVLHIDSIKIFLYEDIRIHGHRLDMVGIQLLSHGTGRNCVGLSLYADEEGLRAEYSVVVNSNSPHRFGYLISDTKEHPLKSWLLFLYPTIKDFFRGGPPNQQKLSRFREMVRCRLTPDKSEETADTTIGRRYINVPLDQVPKEHRATVLHYRS